MFRNLTRLSASMAVLCCVNLLYAEETLTVGSANPGTPELNELRRFEGKWIGKLGNSDLSIPSQRTWVLDGHFLKHDFDSSNGAVRGTIFRGYDNRNHRFTMTFLDSQGNTSLLAGYWQKDLKTFTFEAVDSSCPVQKYESYFPDEKTEQWTITFDPDNSTVINGVATKVE